MRKVLSIICSFFFVFANAQKPFEILNEWVQKAPIQKIYLQLDRENYFAGENAQFKAYLISDYLPDIYNTNIYVELYQGNKLIESSVFPALLGTASGSINFPDSLSAGNYNIRCFSAGMLSQGEDYFFHRNVYIHGTAKNKIAINNKNLQVQFFPEGGSIVSNLSCEVAFKITNSDVANIKINGFLYNDKNEKQLSFQSLHDGMGRFNFEPKEGEKYYVTIESNATEEKFYLPETTNNGIAINVKVNADQCLFEIKQKTTNPDFVAAYMIGQMQHSVVFKNEYTKQKDILKGIIDTRNLPSGIMQITVFNKNDMPLAERLCFINNNEYLIAPEIIFDTLNFSAGSFNKIFIKMKDTIQGKISVAITDPAFDIIPNRETNIISSLLLSSDLKGQISNPAWYLSSAEDTLKRTALDLLMMVNGWRRFKWTELNKLTNNISAPNNSFITIKGKVFLQGTKKPFANKSLLFMINSMDLKKNRSSYFLETDKNGFFKIDSLIMFGKNKLLFMEIKSKKRSLIDVYLEKDSLFEVKSPAINKIFSEDYAKLTPNSKMNIEFDNKQKVKLLKEVIVSSKVKSPLEKIEEKYVSGIFSSDANKTIDLINTDDALNFPNIFDYLNLRIAGLTVTNEGFDYKLFYRQNSSISSYGNIGVILYLDEVETDASAIAALPASQIALVKLYSNLAGAAGNAPGGAISIYTKRTEDYVNNNTLSNFKMYNGYSVTKEFYAPEYKFNNTGLENDNRITIDWRPNIFINNINPKIPISFYNNNRTKQYKIVVEGMTNAGKLIWVEKLITQ